jgi:hypothetical protein
VSQTVQILNLIDLILFEECFNVSSILTVILSDVFY